MPVPLPSALGLLTGTCAFGLYHLAHSLPFNTPRMVLLLSAVGLLTGLFFLASRDIYGTVVFHSFLALKGVSQALADSGRLESFAKLRAPLVATAAAAILILVTVDIALMRSVASALP